MALGFGLSIAEYAHMFKCIAKHFRQDTGIIHTISRTPAPDEDRRRRLLRCYGKDVLTAERREATGARRQHYRDNAPVTADGALTLEPV